MKDAVVAISLFASAVTAQQITSAPKAAFKQASSLQLGNVFAANDGYQVCIDAGDLILDCGKQWGGPEEIQNLPPDEIFGCACCDGGRPVYSDYSSCSSYMASEMSGFTSEAQVYGDLATMCSAMGSCSASATARSATGSSATASARPTIASGSSSSPSSVTKAASGTITATAVASECNQMLGMFSSCMSETPRFADLGFKSQAECYCCASSRGQTTGTLTWTDEIDTYASVCWNWAEASATDTEWNFASTFATYCENFSDVCNGVTVAAAQETKTDASTTGQPTDGVTVTVTGGGGAQNTDEPDAAIGVRAGYAGGVIAVIVGLMML